MQGELQSNKGRVLNLQTIKLETLKGRGSRRVLKDNGFPGAEVRDGTEQHLRVHFLHTILNTVIN